MPLPIRHGPRIYRDQKHRGQPQRNNQKQTLRNLKKLQGPNPRPRVLRPGGFQEHQSPELQQSLQNQKK